jgi:hypothetical protein
MPAVPIVPAFNVRKDGGASFVAGAPADAIHQFALQRRKEALRDRIVLASANPTHTGNHPVLRQQGVVVLRRVLTAAV